MPIPSEKDIQIPLLHLIHDMGGEVKPSEVYDKLADYFRLTEKERQKRKPKTLFLLCNRCFSINLPKNIFSQVTKSKSHGLFI